MQDTHTRKAGLELNIVFHPNGCGTPPNSGKQRIRDAPGRAEQGSDPGSGRLCPGLGGLWLRIRWIRRGSDPGSGRRTLKKALAQDQEGSDTGSGRP